ncbi:MAG: hypothetical protein LBJ12_04790 [Oscillospiraceae bacterium]|jgi:Na+-transporting NADH:ubiquinone oxidoreductase subunit NqrC|nr:hypothetical protein [Oscillospiraceae bacterium]
MTEEYIQRALEVAERGAESLSRSDLWVSVALPAILSLVSAVIVAGATYYLGKKNFRYQTVFDKRAEVIAEIYAKMTQIKEWVFYHEVVPALAPKQVASSRQKLRQLLDDAHTYVTQNRIFLDNKATKIVDEIMRSAFVVSQSDDDNELRKQYNSSGVETLLDELQKNMRNILKIKK